MFQPIVIGLSSGAYLLHRMSLCVCYHYLAICVCSYSVRKLGPPPPGRYIHGERPSLNRLFVGLGTFLYVGVVELLAKELAESNCERGDNRDALLKFALFVVGWGAMAVLALWT